MKKLFSVLLALLVLFTLVGCSTKTSCGGVSFKHPKDWTIVEEYNWSGDGSKTYMVKSKDNTDTDEKAYNLRVWVGEYGNSDDAVTFYYFQDVIYDNTDFADTDLEDCIKIESYEGGRLVAETYIFNYDEYNCRSYSFWYDYNGASSEQINKIRESITFDFLK